MHGRGHSWTERRKERSARARVVLGGAAAVLWCPCVSAHSFRGRGPLRSRTAASGSAHAFPNGQLTATRRVQGPLPVCRALRVPSQLLLPETRELVGRTTDVSACAPEQVSPKAPLSTDGYSLLAACPQCCPIPSLDGVCRMSTCDTSMSTSEVFSPCSKGRVTQLRELYTCGLPVLGQGHTFSVRPFRCLPASYGRSTGATPETASPGPHGKSSVQGFNSLSRSPGDLSKVRFRDTGRLLGRGALSASRYTGTWPRVRKHGTGHG